MVRYFSLLVCTPSKERKPNWKSFPMYPQTPCRFFTIASQTDCLSLHDFIINTVISRVKSKNYLAVNKNEINT